MDIFKTITRWIALCAVFSPLWALEPLLQEKPKTDSRLLDPMMLDGAVDGDYRLGPGDYINIFVEDHNYAVQVGPDGMVTLEEIGPRQVDGLKLSEAQKLLIDALASKYKREYCFVSLARLKRFNLVVGGAVRNPTTLPVDGTARLSWAVHMAGGTLSNADDHNVMLLRKGGDTVRVDLYALTRSGLGEDPQLHQGDRVYVPRRDHRDPQVAVATANGEVHYIPHNERWSVYEYLDFADQWEHRGGADHVAVTRVGGARERVEIGDAGNVSLRPGDRVELGHAPSEVFVGGAVSAPGALPYRSGWKVVDYLKAAGVMIVAEDVRRVVVIRSDKSVEKVETLDAVVQPGDFIRLDKSTLEYVKDWATIITAVVSMVYTIVLINSTTSD